MHNIRLTKSNKKQKGLQMQVLLLCLLNYCYLKEKNLLKLFDYFLKELFELFYYFVII